MWDTFGTKSVTGSLTKKWNEAGGTNTCHRVSCPVHRFIINTPLFLEVDFLFPSITIAGLMDAYYLPFTEMSMKRSNSFCGGTWRATFTLQLSYLLTLASTEMITH